MNYGRKGFTFIELLIVISLGVIISSIGLVGYVNFSRTQILTQSCRKVIADLRLAQSLADNNQKPSGCSTLSGYIFEVVDEQTYRIDADCPEGKMEYKEDSIPNDLSMSGFSQIDFKVLKQGLVPTGGSTLTISGFGRKRHITVSQGGVIKLSGE